LTGWQLSIWNCCRQFFRCGIPVIHLFFAVQRRWSAKRNKKNYDSIECRMPGKSFHVPFWACVP
jgi:hypothetical protein